MKRFLGIALCLVALFSVIRSTNADDRDRKYVATHTVRYGETLWDIASKYQRNDQDTRELIYYINKDNELNCKKFIQPGQKLIIKN